MYKKIIIKNNTSDLVNTTLLTIVDKYLSIGVEIFEEAQVTFGEYLCYIKRLKSGTVTFTFVDNVSASEKEKADE